MNWTLRPATHDDLEDLAELRAVVMRPDLERLGRYDEHRVRQRLRDAYAPEHTRIIEVDGEFAGSITVRPAPPTGDRSTGDWSTGDGVGGIGPSADRAAADRPGADRAAADRPGGDGAAADGAAPDRPGGGRPGGAGTWWLEHFYLSPRRQGRGLGTAVLGSVLAAADADQATVRLNVLQGSPARALYERHGFVVEDEDPVDVFMVRKFL